MRIGFLITLAVWVGASWYYDTLLRQGRWVVEGVGLLWDSVWVMRHIEAHGTSGQRWDVWGVWVDFERQGLFEGMALSYGGRGCYRFWAATRDPAALIQLPGGLVYVDKAGKRLPFTRPLAMPVLEMPRWDSLAIATFLAWWQSEPLAYALTSHLCQRPDGVWQWFGQIFPETFTFGRTEDLAIAVSQWRVYLERLQPKIGAQTCKNVLLYIPGQIVCQKQ